MTIGNSAVSLLDVMRRTVDGKIAKVIEVLNDVNEIVPDIMWMECNDGSSHVVAIRTGLPSVAWKRFNYGVAQSKSQSETVKEGTGMLRAYSSIDKDLADKNGNAGEFRASEDIAFLEAMTQELATTLFYGNVNATPEKFNGLAMRFTTPSTTRTKIGYNMINGGGVGATNTSIWLVSWGDSTVFGLYPKSENAGFEMEDLGAVTETVNGLTNRYYKTEFTWRCGLCVKDWRYVVRICNIDVAALNDAGQSTYDGPAIIQLLIRAVHKMPPSRLGRPVFYVNKDIFEAMDLIANFDNRLALKSVEDVDGKPKISFRGIPIRRCDALLNTESAVTGF